MVSSGADERIKRSVLFAFVAVNTLHRVYFILPTQGTTHNFIINTNIKQLEIFFVFSMEVVQSHVFQDLHLQNLT